MNIGLPAIKYPKPRTGLHFSNKLPIASPVCLRQSGGDYQCAAAERQLRRARALVEDYPKPRGEEISVDLYVTTPGYLQP